MTQFFIQNPGLATFCFVVFCYAMTRPFSYAASVKRRQLRSADIQKHGWPQAPMDADGDIIKSEGRV